MQKTHWAWLSWAVVGLLVVLCAFLAIVQNRWIDELAQGEKSRLRQELQVELNQMSSEFNAYITASCGGLLPKALEVDQLGREKAYSKHYSQWKESHDPVFSNLAVVVPESGALALYKMDLNTAQLSLADWPVPWLGIQDQLMAHYKGEAFGPTHPENTMLIDLPRFGSMGGRGIEQDWLVAELDVNYLRNVLLPELLQKHFERRGKPGYRAELVSFADPTEVIFQYGAGQDEHTGGAPDASVRLFQVDLSVLQPREESHFPKRNPYPPPPPEGGQGRWQLRVRHQAGSLEAVVARARRQNIVISLGILLLILATVVALVRFSRRAQYLAELHMNFVAGVSHELRTPLTVIRTAAFNLRGKMATRPEQVERYGALIQHESEKLGELVEQVLRFAGSRSGHVIREMEPVAVETIIDEGIRTSRAALAGPHLVFEKHFQPDLPLVLADELAMKHVVQNLVDNALKYGTEGNNWIGVFASAVTDDSGMAVEIRVADRGPGIPLGEQAHIFDPFFRGRRAIEDQVHGTGLGLHLVKKIVEAHGGTIRFKSEPMKGTEFVVRIPTTLEAQDEFAHSLS